jgi:hypothetical protein
MGARLEAELLARFAARRYDGLADAEAFAQALTADLQDISKDKHMRVGFERGPRGPMPSPHDLPPARLQLGGIRKIEVLEGNVGYLQLVAMAPLPFARAAIGRAFAFLKSTDALIIDNRTNGGGDARTVALYVSHLTEGAPFVIDAFHWRDGSVVEFRTTDVGHRSYGSSKPVFVLTSSATFSGAEALAYELQALKRAVVVGEVTGGGAHPTHHVELGSGFFAGIPAGASVNPITGGNWEGTGVKPDLGVRADQALAAAQNAAREQLAAASGGPRAPRLAQRGSTPAPGAHNLVTNGDFAAGLAPWGVMAFGGGPPRAYPHRFERGKLCVTVHPRDMLVVGWPHVSESHRIAFREGQEYRLSFQASASGPLSLRASVNAGQRLPPYMRLTIADIPLEPKLRSFSVDFVPDVDEPEGGLAFIVTGEGDEGTSDVCFDEVGVTGPSGPCTTSVIPPSGAVRP